MRSYTIKKSRLLFAIISIVNIIMSVKFGFHYLEYVLLAYLCLALMLKALGADEFLILSLFIPNKYLQLISIPIYLAFTGKIISSRLKTKEVGFLIYIMGMSVINCLIYDGFLLGTIFQVTVYYLIIKLLSSYGDNINKSIILEILDEMFGLQVVSCLIQMLIYKRLGDPITGTLISAHYLGVFLMVYLHFLLLDLHNKRKTIKYIIKILIIVFLIFASDAKHVALVFLFSYIINKVMNNSNINNRLTFLVSIMTVFVVASVIVISDYHINLPEKINSLMEIYVYGNKYNRKYEMFLRTFNVMRGINGLFGFGVGQFGSQISLTLSKGIIYDWRPEYSFYRFAITPYKDTVKGIMTEWYTRYGIGESSMVLGYPLVSFVALFAELGVIGYLWLLRIFDKQFRHGDVSFLTAFFLLTLFDTYFEIPCVFVLILIATYANENRDMQMKRVEK